MAHIEKSKEILKPKEREKEDSLLYQEFKNLKPQYNSNNEAVKSAQHELEKLAAQNGLSIDELLAEAHSSPKLKEHYTQALKLERMIGHLRK